MGYHQAQRGSVAEPVAGVSRNWSRGPGSDPPGSPVAAGCLKSPPARLCPPPATLPVRQGARLAVRGGGGQGISGWFRHTPRIPGLCGVSHPVVCGL